jgi:hypothetical protein
VRVTRYAMATERNPGWVTRHAIAIGRNSARVTRSSLAAGCTRERVKRSSSSRRLRRGAGQTQNPERLAPLGVSSGCVGRADSRKIAPHGERLANPFAALSAGRVRCARSVPETRTPANPGAWVTRTGTPSRIRAVPRRTRGHARLRYFVDRAFDFVALVLAEVALRVALRRRFEVRLTPPELLRDGFPVA